MLTLLYGNNYDAQKKAFDEIVKGQTPDYISIDTFEVGKLAQLVAGSNLFGETETLVFSGVLENTEITHTVLSYLDTMDTSPNHFIFLETKMLKKDLAPFEKAKAKIFSHNLPPKTKKDDQKFKIFDLTDAFGTRNKKQCWILYTKATQANLPPEEIHGTFWWYMKNMMIVSREKKNPGLHPFVYEKTQKALKKYSNEELYNMERKLITMFHDSRRGKSNLALENEKFILSI